MEQATVEALCREQWASLPMPADPQPHEGTMRSIMLLDES